jgi:iron complex transport system ATP-binding protein
MVDMKAIEIHDLQIAYPQKKSQDRVLLRDFELEVDRGEVIAVIGENGAGKSSLLRVISGLQSATAGEVLWAGRPLLQIPMAERPRHLSALFRGFARPDGFTVRDLVRLGRHPYSGYFGRLSQQDADAVERALHTAGILQFAATQVATLSDGELQKALIAKMLAQDAPIMVLDEPDTHLDLPSAIELLQLLKHLAAKEGRTIVFSTHNLALAFRLIGRILLLNGKGSWTAGTPTQVSGHHLMCDFLRTEHIRFADGNLIFEFDNNED